MLWKLGVKELGIGELGVIFGIEECFGSWGLEVGGWRLGVGGQGLGVRGWGLGFWGSSVMK